ncbi:MAG: Ig-like domain-containing protein [archaeon]|mgnify:CR=1 FL=1
MRKFLLILSVFILFCSAAFASTMTLSISQPATNTYFKAASNIVFAWTDDNASAVALADLNIADSTGTSVVYFNDVNLKDSNNSSGTYTFNYNFISLADGNYTLDINVFDETGAFAYVHSSSFMVDDKKPDVNADYNKSWQNVNATVHLYCNDLNSQSGTGNASGASTITYTLDGSSATYSASTGVSISSDLNHTLAFYCVDLAGNQSDTNTIYVRIDKTDPTISSDKNVHKKTSASIDVNIADALSGLNQADVSMVVKNASGVSYGGTLTKTARTDTNGYVLTFTPTSTFSDGNVWIDVNAVDVAGNDLNIGFYYTIDTQAPTISTINLATSSIAYAASDKNYVITATPTFDINGFDNEHYTPNAALRMAFSCDNSSWSSPETYASTKSSFNIASATGCPTNADGNRTVYLKILDLADNNKNANVAFYYDVNGPSVPTPSASVSGSTIILSWGAASVIGAPVKEYEMYKNDINQGNTASTSYSFASQSNGTYTFKVRAKDYAGNYGAFSATVSATVTGSSSADTSTSAANASSATTSSDTEKPAITWVNPDSDEKHFSSSPIKFSIKATDSSGIQKVLFFLDDAALSTVGSADDAGNYAYEYSYDETKYGKYTLKVKAFGNGGTEDVTEASRVIYLDNPVQVSTAAVVDAVKSQKTVAEEKIAKLTGFGIELPADVSLMLSQANLALNSADTALSDSNYSDANSKAEEAKKLFDEFLSSFDVTVTEKEISYGKAEFVAKLKELKTDSSILDDATSTLNKISLTKQMKIIEVKHKNISDKYVRFTLKIARDENYLYDLNLNIVEVIPKEIAKDANSIVSDYNFTVLESDPVLLFTINLPGISKIKETVDVNLDSNATANLADESVDTSNVVYSAEITYYIKEKVDQDVNLFSDDFNAVFAPTVALSETENVIEKLSSNQSAGTGFQFPDLKFTWWMPIVVIALIVLILGIVLLGRRQKGYSFKGNSGFSMDKDSHPVEDFASGKKFKYRG